MSQPKLLSVVAFYKNDLPGGIGIQLTYEYVSDLNAFMREFCIAYRLLSRAAVIDSNQRFLIRDSTARLETIGRRDKRRPIDDSDTSIIIGNIWLLEQLHAIKSDEYNGMSYIAEGGRYQPPRLNR